jgi:putative sigma-54 modulation protein
MQIQVQSIHFKADGSLIQYIQDKLNKLTLFHPGIIAADVFLRLEKDQERENKCVEVKLNVPGSDVFSSRKATSFEEAASDAAEALRKQLEKARNRAA